MSGQWVVASGNAGKIAELAALLAGLDIEPVSQAEFDVGDADETGIAFVDNALIKARHAANATGLPAIADDSGLAVDYLAGAPGIFSARYAGTHGDDAANNAKLLSELDGVDREARGASFHCCLVALRSPADPAPITARSKVFWSDWGMVQQSFIVKCLRRFHPTAWSADRSRPRLPPSKRG